MALPKKALAASRQRTFSFPVLSFFPKKNKRFNFMIILSTILVQKILIPLEREKSIKPKSSTIQKGRQKRIEALKKS